MLLYKLADLLKHNLPKLDNHAVFLGGFNKGARQHNLILRVPDSNQCFCGCKGSVCSGINRLIIDFESFIFNGIQNQLLGFNLMIHGIQRGLIDAHGFIFAEIHIVQTDVAQQM